MSSPHTILPSPVYILLHPTKEVRLLFGEIADGIVRIRGWSEQGTSLRSVGTGKKGRLVLICDGFGVVRIGLMSLSDWEQSGVRMCRIRVGVADGCWG